MRRDTNILGGHLIRAQIGARVFILLQNPSDVLLQSASSDT